MGNNCKMKEKLFVFLTLLQQTRIIIYYCVIFDLYIRIFCLHLKSGREEHDLRSRGKPPQKAPQNRSRGQNNKKEPPHQPTQNRGPQGGGR